MIHYREFFAFQKEPFSQEVALQELYPLPEMEPLLSRFDYAIRLGAVGIITGEIGSGKSTSLRFAASKLHPSEFKVLPILAHFGTLKEFLKQITFALGMDRNTYSLTTLFKTLRSLVLELADSKQHPVILIDEAHLLRSEVLGHLHILMQYEFDSKPLVPMILSGQNELLDKLHMIYARPLASRVVARTHLESLTLQDTKGYLKHRLEIAGVRKQLFSEEAVLAIHQGSGGLLRKANLLARGALVASASEGTQIVSAEHVRIASTEVI